MANQLCPICNENKLGIMSSERIQDGKICRQCEEKLGLSFSSPRNMPILETLTIETAKSMISNGDTFDYKNEKEKRKQKKAESKQKIEEQNDQRLNDIKTQMQKAGVSDLFGTKKEVRALPGIMTKDEVIQYATSGFVDSGTVLVVITNQRLIFIDRGIIYGTNFRELPFTKINSVSYSTGLINADIAIENGATTTAIQRVAKETAPIFVDILKKSISNQNNSSQVQESIKPNETASFSDTADALFKLKELLDADILTQEEFDKKKAELLG